ncbi:PDC sensor domain-containing protein [Aeromonas sp. 164P]
MLTRQLYRHIEVLPEGLALDKLPGDLPAGLAGNLTGDGPLPPPGSAREAQLHLALSLSPLLSTASQRLGSEIAWAYFTGVDNFIYLYPWIPSSQFRFARSIYDKSYWQDALMSPNPSLHATVSRPYEDFAGLGTMVTMSQPLYKDGSLVGMISMDMLLSRCNRSSINWHRRWVFAAQSVPSGAGQQRTPARGAQSRRGSTDEYQWRQGALQLTMAIPTPLRLVHSVTLLPAVGPALPVRADPARPVLHGLGRALQPEIPA